MDRFIDSAVNDYDSQRDLPDLAGTSKLSPHLAAGTLSANHCIKAAYVRNGHRLSGGNPNIDTWISELVWREFYNHILAEHPRLAMGRAFKPETDALPWYHSSEQLERWQRGETGFPFVDAGMRQLNATGWMHNRLRMVTASLETPLPRLAFGRLFHESIGRFCRQQRRLAVECFNGYGWRISDF